MNRPADPVQTWLDARREALRALDLGAQVRSIGHVLGVADGIARIDGLPEARLGERLVFADGGNGFVLALDEHALDAVLLDAGDGVRAGSEVSGGGGMLTVPVGPALLGRVVDPLGRPLDEGPPIEATARWPIERAAPGIIEREVVNEPVWTGTLVVDALFPVGRGQRELIIGDRATGKTALAVEAIINQKHSDIVCVYVAVGQRAHAVQQVIEAVRRHGAPDRCVFVVAGASATAGLQWCAPFAGFSMAEYFRDHGGHALIVIDDLTKHAATHRELALLTHQPPGREAYPGDVFHLHARLLERAARLSHERGGGSLTALPIAQTEAGNLAAYIPTNLISITDGQLVLDASQFAADLRPAVDVGLSVSRVGGKAQWPALREVAGPLRLQYAQFLELELFTRFGNLTDARVRQRIERGRRIRALLTQPRFAALRPGDQVALLAALGAGVLDAYPAGQVAQMRTHLPSWLDSHAGAALRAVEAGQPLQQPAREALTEAVRALATELAAAEASP